MIARRERFSGNILFYDYLAAKRAPTFLNRNLTRALAIHQHLLKNGSLREFAGDDHSSRVTWEPPSWDDLDDMMDHSNANGSFVLDIHGVQAAGKTEPQRGKTPARKARMLWLAKGVLQVSVFRSKSNLPCFSLPAQDVTLKQMANDNDRALMVEADCIVIKPSGFNPAGILPGESYKVNISMTLDSLDDAVSVYQQFSTQAIDLNDCSTRFTASYEDILECPSSRAILPFRDYKTRLAFGLEVLMYWTKPKEMPILAVHDSTLRAMALPDSYPSPPPDPRSCRPSVKLMFVYANETIERTDFTCPHEDCRQRKSKDIDDLRMHLDSWHDFFKYKAKFESRNARGQETWVFRCEVTDHRSEQRASARADEPSDARIVAPSQPFNQARYLNEGNEDYQRMARLEKRHTLYRTTSAFRPTMHVPDPSRRKPSEIVADIPARERMRHPVPQAPAGITFIRAKSRRPLRTDEYISESDDEVEDTWIQLRRIAEFDKDQVVPDNVKQFLKVFDQYMWEEHLETDFYIGDTITRFARSKRAWIQQEGVFETFKQKLDELFRDQLISKKVHDSCQEVVIGQESKVGAEGASKLSQQLAKFGVDTLPLDKRKGKAKVTETGNLTPITTDSDGDLEMRGAVLSKEHKDPHDKMDEGAPYDLCICGLDAQVARAQIDCSNMVRLTLNMTRPY
jgi:hypothetical protein